VPPVEDDQLFQVKLILMKRRDGSQIIKKEKEYGYYYR